MTWFRVDDSLAFHSKVVGVGNAPLGLWVRAGAWCAQQLSDGVVPAHMVKALGGTIQHAKALVAFGLWEQMDDGSYLFHDWHLYQPTAAEVKAERLARSEAKAKAGRAGGIASGVSRRANKEANAKQNEAEHEANANENEAPSLPIPTHTPSVSPRDLAFEEFWLVYPRKISKGHARKAWDRALKKAAPEELIQGAVRLARQNLEERFTPHAATWLNGERWLDMPVEQAADPQYAWDV